MNYLDLLPSELVTEILLHLDVRDLESLAKVSELVEKKIEDKYFWIKKFQFDNLHDYIDFLGDNQVFMKPNIIGKNRGFIHAYIISKTYYKVKSLLNTNNAGTGKTY